MLAGLLWPCHSIYNGDIYSAFQPLEDTMSSDPRIWDLDSTATDQQGGSGPRKPFKLAVLVLIAALWASPASAQQDTVHMRVQPGDPGTTDVIADMAFHGYPPGNPNLRVSLNLSGDGTGIEGFQPMRPGCSSNAAVCWAGPLQASGVLWVYRQMNHGRNRWTGSGIFCIFRHDESGSGWLPQWCDQAETSLTATTPERYLVLKLTTHGEVFVSDVPVVVTP
jgi:hypothetical protein